MKKESPFIEAYIKQMTHVMQITNPSWKKKDIEHTVKKMLAKQMVNPKVTLDNNYTGESRDSTLLSVLDWTFDRKPLIAGNGTFYRNQHEGINPVARMLDGWGAERKALKKEMFQVGEELGSDTYEYNDLDRKQDDKKRNMNSWYGGSGSPFAAFYSKYSGPATTLTAQSVISTAETFFEGFLADNYSFLNITELMTWIEKVLKDKITLDKFILRATHEEVYERLLDKIIMKNNNDEEILFRYLYNLSEDELTVLYYKNNLIQFIKDHKYIQDILLEVFRIVENLEYVDPKDNNWLDKIPSKYQSDFARKRGKDWNKFVNKMYFMDPNDPPKNIMEPLVLFTDYIEKYVYVKYLSFDRIYRLRNFKRKVVTVIDTDSNFLSIDTLMDYVMDEVVKDNRFGRSWMNNVFVGVNTITYVITRVINNTLLYYGECSNIPEEYRSRFNIKNEFFNTLLIIGAAKKRYISKQMLREGNLLNPPKVDIKGFDFKKATCSEYAEEAFMKIIKERIIEPEAIDVAGMIYDIMDFKEEVRSSIKRGEREFLPNGNAKEKEAYKDPGSEQSYRGVLTWNILYPDNAIEFPSKVSLLKMNIFNEKDMEKLQDTHPDIYQTIMDKIFNDDTGIFVTKKWDPGIEYVNPKDKEWFKKIPSKYRTKYKKLGAKKWNDFVDTIDLDDPKFEKEGKWVYSKRGLQVLAIPSNATIPEWADPYIDYSTMLNNIIAPFKPVLEIFGPQFAEEGKTRNGVNRKSDTVTNIVKF